ncbi:hypothetical protein GGI11_000914 [Coemansia sp. RSA 2049]|nr:hypothetical protein GGI11_000914 [Coemansia sp. RSA 2049]
MSYQFLRTLTIIHWGILSDRIGRRPVILMGLLGDLLTFVLFGVSKSFKWALVARSLNGFFTGGTVVIKSIIAEISDDTNRGRMMAMFPLMWHFGSMLGGAIGGLFVDPATPLVSEAQSEEGRCRIDSESEQFSKWDILTPTVIRILITNLVLCLAISMHNQLYPIFAATDIADGGLGMDARTIGYTFMLCGLLVVYMQLALYPKYERKYGALECYLL